MPSNHLPAPPPSPESFRPENFKRETTFRDYLIYGLVLIIVGGLAGGTAYYFTRPEAEKGELRAKFNRTFGKTEPDDGKKIKLKQPKLDGLFGEGDDDAAAAAAKKNKPPAATGASSYAGGRTRVLPVDDPKLAKATPEFIAFAEALKVNGVFQGNPAKVMLNGRLFRAGDEIDPQMGVTFAGLDGVKKFFVLRDKSGAELHLTY